MKNQNVLRGVLVISNLEYGGAQRQVIELVNNIDANHFDLHVCTLSNYVPLASELVDPERRLHIIQKQWKFDLTVVPRLAILLRRLRADFVHSYLFDADIAVRLAGRLARTPLVVGSERNTNYSLKPRQLMAYRLTRRFVDFIIANSHDGAAFNGRTLGYPPSVYRVVHNGVNVVRFRPQDGSEVRRTLGIAADEYVVGMFASFKQQKNHSLLFAAATQVLQQVPRTRFLFVGDELYAGMHGSDEYKRRIHKMVDDLGLRERCLFLGNQDDVVPYYNACDVTVMPSLFEGTPNVVLESLACGVPVVVTDVSDNASLVPDGQVGYVVPLGDDMLLAERICHLLSDATLRSRMGQNARTWVKQEFSTERLAEKTAAVYREALEHKR